MAGKDALDLVYEAIDEVNVYLPPDAQVSKRPDVPLTGAEATADSLALAQLVTCIEERVVDADGMELDFEGAWRLPEAESPFRSVGALAAFVAREVERLRAT